MSPLIKTIGLDSEKLSKLNQSLSSLEANFALDSTNIHDLKYNNSSNSKSIFLLGADNISIEDFYRFLSIFNEENYKTLILLPMAITDISQYFRYGLDFCMPPHSAKEIMMRITLLQGLNQQNNNQIIELGKLTINPITYEVFVNNKKVNLTFKEYELLKFLASKPGRVFSRESLLHSVWNYDYYGGTRTVDVHIRRLRNKINDVQNNFIETIWNVGYKFRTKNSESSGNPNAQK